MMDFKSSTHPASETTHQGDRRGGIVMPWLIIFKVPNIKPRPK